MTNGQKSFINWTGIAAAAAVGLFAGWFADMDSVKVQSRAQERSAIDQAREVRVMSQTLTAHEGRLSRVEITLEQQMGHINYRLNEMHKTLQRIEGGNR